jgi:hypothetical protein
MRRGPNRRLTINNIQSQWKLSPVDLGENWPTLLNHLRRSGNRRFNPISYFSPTFTSFDDVQIEQLAWDYIASRCAILEDQSRFGNTPPVNGFDDENILLHAFNEAQYLYRQGFGFECTELLVDCLNLFERICARLGSAGGRGYGKGIYMEVIEMARIFSPFVAEINPEWMYSILASLDKMTGHDYETLQRMLVTISPVRQDEILDIAVMEYQFSNTILAYQILEILN